MIKWIQIEMAAISGFRFHSSMTSSQSQRVPYIHPIHMKTLANNFFIIRYENPTKTTRDIRIVRVHNVIMCMCVTRVFFLVSFHSILYVFLFKNFVTENSTPSTLSDYLILNKYVPTKGNRIKQNNDSSSITLCDLTNFKL